MNSANTRSVAADSNVLLAAVAGRAARRVFQSSELIVVTTEHNVAEIREYIPEFAARYGLPEELLFEILGLLPITVYAEHEYAATLPAARDLVAKRDEDDVALAALALTLHIPIWSNDRDYGDFPTGVFTTATLLKILGV
ncbi:MAG TPA: PIN domain-containing protein [Thermoanaerobaculia bacterium]|nr:PIN domain-containing protein [Thermoanaerobaculia bacterium]